MLQLPPVGIAAIILGFGFLIFVHELGHFLAAKWVGIRATQFAIGFGQSLLTWRKGMGFCVGTTEKAYFEKAAEHLKSQGKTGEPTEADLYAAADELGLGETEYRLNWMPLGGYVKMVGQEDMDPSARSDDPRAFNNKSISARALVISAGVIMNIIFGFIFFIIAFSMGVEFPAPRVGGTQSGSPAATTYATGHDEDEAYLGLQPGDLIVSIDGKPVADMLEARMGIALAAPGQSLDIQVERPGEEDLLTYAITPKKDNRQENLLSAGIAPPASLVLEQVYLQRDAYEAGVRPGMAITEINGESINFFYEYRQAILDAQGQPVTVTFASPDSQETIELEQAAVAGLQRSEDDDRIIHFLGMVPPLQASPIEDSPAEKAGVEPGDLLVRVGDVSWPTKVEDIAQAIAQAEGKALEVVVLRQNEDEQWEEITLADVQPEDDKLGIWAITDVESNIIADVLEGSPAAALGLSEGMMIQTFMGEPVAHWSAIQTYVNQAQADGQLQETLTFTAIDQLMDAEPETFELAMDDELQASLASLDWAVPSDFIPAMLNITRKADGPVDAIMIGLDKTQYFMVTTYQTLARLFQGTVGVKNLRGPVGIVAEGKAVASRGLTYLLFFLGLISINLAVLNFLPIPIVDGGLMVFLIYEKIRGKPAGPKVQTAAMVIGLALLATLFVVVTYNDIARLFT